MRAALGSRRGSAVVVAALWVAGCGDDGRGERERDAGAGDSGADVVCDPAMLTWTEAPSLPAGRESLALVAAGEGPGTMFAIGGWSGTGAERTVFAADYDALGVPRAWETASLMLSGPLEHHAAVYVRGMRDTIQSIHLVGGDDGTRALDAFPRYSLVEGTTTALELRGGSTGSTLPAPRTSHGLVFDGTRAFLIGGSLLGAGPQAQVWSTGVSGDWLSGTWREATPLPEPISFVAAAVVGDTIVVAGGMGTAGPRNRVLFAVIDGAGELGPWRDGPALPFASFGHALTAVGEHVYATGGVDASMDAHDEVYALRVERSGVLGPSWELAAPLPAARFGHAVTVAQNAIVVAGGWPDGTFAEPPVASVYVGRACR